MSSSANTVRSFRDLIVWQRSMRLVSMAYAIAKSLPRHELYGLASQIRRAAVSIPANLAEGHGRSGTGEYRYHASVSYGSLMELQTLVLVTVQEGYCSEEQTAGFFGEADDVGRMLNALMRALGRGARSPRP